MYVKASGSDEGAAVQNKAEMNWESRAALMLRLIMSEEEQYVLLLTLFYIRLPIIQMSTVSLCRFCSLLFHKVTQAEKQGKCSTSDWPE